MSCYNHSVQGDYSRVLNFKMAALHSVKCLRGSVKCSGKTLVSFPIFRREFSSSEL